MKLKKKKMQVEQDFEEAVQADGEDSASASPVGNQTPKRRADNRNPEASVHKQGSSDEETPGQTGTPERPLMKVSKTAKMGAVVSAMKSMSKEDLDAIYNAVLGEEGEEIDGDDLEEFRVPTQITTDDVDLSNEIDTIFDGEDFSEEFLNKAAFVLENAVVTRVNDILEGLSVQVENDLNESVDTMAHDMVDRLDRYLDYVVESWMEENRLAVQHGIRSEMVETFISGLKDLFDEHYISIPEEKVDVVDELVARVEELEEELSKRIDENTEMTAALKSVERDLVFETVSEGLTDVQAERLLNLAESVEFVNAEDFTEKLNTLKETYFSEEGTARRRHTLNEELENADGPVEMNEEGSNENSAVPPHMQLYANVLSRQSRK